MEENQLSIPKNVILIGGSAGSLDVLLQVLPELGTLNAIAMVIVLHRRNSDDRVLEELLRMKSGLTVVEIEDKTPLLPGHVYVAPADYHLLFETNSTFSLDVSEKIHYSRPSIDVAFESAAEVCGEKLVAILLSGANSDGTDGLLSVKRNGGVVIVQSPKTADVPFMPEFALRHVDADYTYTPAEMTAFIKVLRSAD